MKLQGCQFPALWCPYLAWGVITARALPVACLMWVHRAKEETREDSPGFPVKSYIACDSMWNKELFKGRMKKRWAKGWAVTECSKRNKFRLCVTCATLGLIHLVQEKYSVHSSSPVNMNGLRNLRIHLQTTYTHIILFALTLPSICGPWNLMGTIFYYYYYLGKILACCSTILLPFLFTFFLISLLVLSLSLAVHT